MQHDGLFRLPNTPNDWLVIAISISSFLYVMWKKRNLPNMKNPSVAEWNASFFITVVISNSMYEWFLIDGIKIEYISFPLFMSIVLAPDLIDYLMLDKQGKFFVIKTFKSMINGFLSTFLKNFGYEKKDTENN